MSQWEVDHRVVLEAILKAFVLAERSLSESLTMRRVRGCEWRINPRTRGNECSDFLHNRLVGSIPRLQRIRGGEPWIYRSETGVRFALVALQKSPGGWVSVAAKKALGALVTCDPQLLIPFVGRTFETVAKPLLIGYVPNYSESGQEGDSEARVDARFLEVIVAKTSVQARDKRLHVGIQDAVLIRRSALLPAKGFVPEEQMPDPSDVIDDEGTPSASRARQCHHHVRQP